LLTVCVQDVSGLLVKNLDFDYIGTTMLPSLMQTDGAWGMLMRTVNRHLVYHSSGTTLRLKLLEFLIQVDLIARKGAPSNHSFRLTNFV